MSVKYGSCGLPSCILGLSCTDSVHGWSCGKVTALVRVCIVWGGLVTIPRHYWELW